MKICICLFFSLVLLVDSFYTPINIKSNKQIYASKGKVIDKYFSNSDILQKIYSKYIPSSKNQQKYVDILNCNDVKMVLVTGSTGSGKTLFAVTQAIEFLLKEKIEKIIITRPVISVEEDIGFLPGTMEEKMNPWLQPIYDVLYKFFDSKELGKLFTEKKIEICPVGYMRGRSFHNTYIIADEMQNSTPQQMKMITTRVGINSKLVITGDNEQSDIENNGLLDLTKRLSNTKNRNVKKMIKIIEMKESDVMRSSLTKNIIKLYNEENTVKDKLESKVITKADIKLENIPENKKIITNTTITNKPKEKTGFTKVPDFKTNTNPSNDCAMIPLDQIPKNKLINGNNHS